MVPLKESEMRRSGTGSGGGYGSTQHRDVRAPKVEPRAKGVNVGGAAQLGAAQGDHITGRMQSDRYRGEPLYGGGAYNPPVGPTSNMVSGPGGGRRVYGCGSQSTYGSPAPGSPRESSQLFPGWPAPSKR
jgi:hypothetical protein